MRSFCLAAHHLNKEISAHLCFRYEGSLMYRNFMIAVSEQAPAGKAEKKLAENEVASGDWG